MSVSVHDLELLESSGRFTVRAHGKQKDWKQTEKIWLSIWKQTRFSYVCVQQENAREERGRGYLETPPESRVLSGGGRVL